MIKNCDDYKLKILKIISITRVLSRSIFDIEIVSRMSNYFHNKFLVSLNFIYKIIIKHFSVHFWDKILIRK